MPTVLLERIDERVALLTLNRPEQLNAITFELVRGLHDALDTIAGDPECRVAILTGAGRGFCAGLDLRNWGTPPEPGEHPRATVGVGGQEFLANLTVHIRQTPRS